ncbi:MAG TPA: hydrogenase expression/formation protein HypE [Acidimicrobiales bacterium]|nr:hydrogenase expression/formation protein HypE [Acidimicrobiales bacterium]
MSAASPPARTTPRPRAASRPEGVVTMAHGAGGKASHALVESVFLEAFSNPALAPLNDGAVLDIAGQDVAFTTDSFVVSPIFFPGGSLGDLAVNGTVNDLAACGAQPLALSAGFVIEEGFPVEDLARVVDAMGRSAQRAGVPIVTGDTKVVQRGKGDGCYVNTSGIGLVDRRATGLAASSARPGDAVIISGPIGDHGTAVLLARGELGISADVCSDTAPLNGLVAALLEAVGPAVHVLRDATRGGVATVLNEIAAASGAAIVLDEDDIPVRPQVAGVCELLGIDPLYVACEGRMVVVVARERAGEALRAMRSHPLGAGSAVIGRADADPAGLVLEETSFGGARVVDMLVGDPLPRIC